MGDFTLLITDFSDKLCNLAYLHQKFVLKLNFIILQNMTKQHIGLISEGRCTGWCSGQLIFQIMSILPQVFGETFILLYADRLDLFHPNDRPGLFYRKGTVELRRQTFGCFEGRTYEKKHNHRQNFTIVKCQQFVALERFTNCAL